MKRVLGLPDQAALNCTQAIKLNPTYLKALLRRAEIYEETEKLGKFLLGKWLSLKLSFLCSRRSAERLSISLGYRSSSRRG